MGYMQKEHFELFFCMTNASGYIFCSLHKNVNDGLIAGETESEVRPLEHVAEEENWTTATCVVIATPRF